MSLLAGRLISRPVLFYVFPDRAFYNIPENQFHIDKNALHHHRRAVSSSTLPGASSCPIFLAA
jgi:hypothetical protein